MNKINTTIEDILSKGFNNYYSSEYGQVYDFYLTSSIGEADQYIDWFQRIRNARQSDIINLHINCPGGNLFTTVQFMQSISECQARVIMNVAGACMSAATLIFLLGDEFIINEHSVFLFHNYSGGMFGKGGEMYHGMVHDRKWTEKLFRSSYEDFLTSNEITNLMDDKDIWMDAETVIARIEKRGRAIMQKQQELEKAQLKQSKKRPQRKTEK